LRKQKEEEAALKAQREREAVNSSVPKTRSIEPEIISDKEAEDEANREAARMAKMFGGPAPKKESEPPKKGVDALIQNDREHDPYLISQDHQHTAEQSKPHDYSDWRKQEDEFLNKVPITEAEAEADREAARMGKMFGLSPGKLTVPSPKTTKTKSSSVGSAPLVEESSDDREGAREAERMARVMGGNAKKYDPKEEERERERKKFEQSLAGIHDPKELSKAFLHDPSMLAHLKDVKPVLAVNTLKGVDVPGHKF
jgi:hypothetical protein